MGDFDGEQKELIKKLVNFRIDRCYRISLEKCSFAEILDAYRKRGISRKRRGNLHGLASTNRSFAHFRWW
ncbi:hypothetical protein DAI22_06g136150 [Oryza sativa Japonica Group]|nr:hypothetical protein DAI22_06g136150 [Oryza sativa Japonica Group]